MDVLVDNTQKYSRLKTDSERSSRGRGGLKELGISLPEVSLPTANYAPCTVVAGGMVFVSDQRQ